MSVSKIDDAFDVRLLHVPDLQLTGCRTSFCFVNLTFHDLWMRKMCYITQSQTSVLNNSICYTYVRFLTSLQRTYSIKCAIHSYFFAKASKRFDYPAM